MVTSYYHPECFFTKTMPRARAWKVASIEEVQLPAELTAGACSGCVLLLLMVALTTGASFSRLRLSLPP